MRAEPALYKPLSGVYALVDPRDDHIAYVGVAIDLEYRFRQHLDPNSYDGNVVKKRWVAGLKALGMLPKLILLAECDYPASEAIEREEIKRLKDLGQAELNRAGGGRQNRGTLKLATSHPDSWLAVGRELKSLRDAIMDLTRTVGVLGGPKLSSYILEATRPLENAALRIDMKLAETYPGWTEFASAFYGEDSPTT